MSIEQFRFFLAILDRGSFAAAARELGRTEGAVSKQIKQLENVLDVTLFDRRSKPPTPTSIALDLAPSAREAVAAYQTVFAQAKIVSHDIKGEIRLGVIPTVSHFLLAPTLARLRTRFPSLRVRIENGLSGNLIDHVLQGKLDAALTTQPDRFDQRLNFEMIATEAIVLIAPKNLQNLDVARLLREEPVIRFNRAAGVGKIIDGLLAELAPGRGALIELDSIQSIIEMVSHGLGVALIPEPGFGFSRLILDRICVKPIPLNHAERSIVLARLGALDDHRMIDTIRDAFRAALQTYERR